MLLKSENHAPSWLKRLFAGHLMLPRNAADYYRPSVWNWPERELVIFLRVRSIHFATMPEPHENFQRLTNLLPVFRSLQEVSFATKDSHLDAGLLAPLVKCTAVVDLRPWCSDIDDAGIAAISEMHSLSELNLNNCPNVTDGAVDSLLKIQSLEILWLKGTSISNAGLKRLLELPKLKIVSTDANSPETLKVFRNKGILEDQPSVPVGSVH